MKQINFKEVDTEGLETSINPAKLAGLRAHEARYFWNKYKHEFVTYLPTEKPSALTFLNEVLLERDLVFKSEPLEVAEFQLGSEHFFYVFYANGLAINAIYADPAADGRRAVGFKLAEGVEIPSELVDKFKFARQKSLLAGEIRGSYFKIKKDYELPS